METLLLNIIDILRDEEQIDSIRLQAIIRAYNKGIVDNRLHHAKKHLLPYYRSVKNHDIERWESWNISPELERRIIRTLQVKPRRTTSGVATVTVISKPWPCSSDCIYCPNDIRMPKSYLSDEPACQRAERNFFDPFLQVTVRLRTLADMGHPIDKVELIVLGGTWSDYSEEYRLWFVRELFRALNEFPGTTDEIKARRHQYEELGISADREERGRRTCGLQEKIDADELSYNQAFTQVYGKDTAWDKAAAFQTATLEDVLHEHDVNVDSGHRVVGFVIETRPDTITPDSLELLRKLGATKVQIGIQSLDEDLLRDNHRYTQTELIARAVNLIRLYGFKIHTHFMVNLYGATPEADKRDYAKFISDERFLPDEVKLYPCALVESAHLVDYYNKGLWRPYTEEELVDVLVADILKTQPYTRISRMIRDISAQDIMVGNKKGNFRQIVEEEIKDEGDAPVVQEIRFREIKGQEVDFDELTLNEFPYTTASTEETFLQWVTPDNKIVGFLRLSIPRSDYLSDHELQDIPAKQNIAMIREVHVYGAVAKLGKTSSHTQHHGLGRALVERACELAKEAGCTQINVISSVGTRNYYKKLGFENGELYQERML